MIWYYHPPTKGSYILVRFLHHAIFFYVIPVNYIVAVVSEMFRLWQPFALSFSINQSLLPPSLLHIHSLFIFPPSLCHSLCCISVSSILFFLSHPPFACLFPFIFISLFPSLIHFLYVPSSSIFLPCSLSFLSCINCCMWWAHQSRLG